MKILLATIAALTIASFTGSGQRGDSVDTPIVPTDTLPGTKALVAEIAAGKMQIEQNLEYFKWLAEQKNIDSRRISELEKQLLESRAAEVRAKSQRDTVPVYLQPKVEYHITKVIFSEQKGGGKKSRGVKVAYDTANDPIVTYTIARNP